MYSEIKIFKQKFKKIDYYNLLLYGLISVFVLVQIANLILGKGNPDEGWILTASKLVYEGKVPYKDFNYTQMPLLPYI